MGRTELSMNSRSLSSPLAAMSRRTAMASASDPAEKLVALLGLGQQWLPDFTEAERFTAIA